MIIILWSGDFIPGDQYGEIDSLINIQYFEKFLLFSNPSWPLFYNLESEMRTLRSLFFNGFKSSHKVMT